MVFWLRPWYTTFVDVERTQNRSFGRVAQIPINLSMAWFPYRPTRPSNLHRHWYFPGTSWALVPGYRLPTYISHGYQTVPVNAIGQDGIPRARPFGGTQLLFAHRRIANGTAVTGTTPIQMRATWTYQFGRLPANTFRNRSENRKA
jgi:hypothetical protein